MKQSLAHIQLDYRKARSTDKNISYGAQLIWMLLTGTIIWLPVYTILLFAIPALKIITESTGYLIASYFFGLYFYGIWWHVLTFKLVNRHTNHLRRKGKLLEDLVDYTKEKAEEKRTGEEITKKIYSLEIMVNQYYKSLQLRHPGTWTIVGILSMGISAYYAAFFLMTDLQKIQQIEDDFLQVLSEVLMELEVLRYPITYEKDLPQREYGIFAAVSIVTFGLYWFYWWYILVTDENRFFENSERWEAALVFSLFYSK